MKRIKLHSELVYIFAILLISFSVAMVTTTGFGVSMIVAPAYILSEKVPFLTFGQSEYVVQGILFVVFCILMKRVKWSYFSSFVTGLIYGACLDCWQLIIPHFNPAMHAPGTLPFWLRCVYFVVSMVLTSLAVALFFKSYICPQVYDFFVKGITHRYNLNLTKFKYCFDAGCLLVAVAMSLLMFHKFVGVGVGTLILAVCNGGIIGFFDRTYDKYFETVPLLPKFAKHFEL